MTTKRVETVKCQDLFSTINVTEGSNFVEDYLVSIRLLQVIPTGLVKEDNNKKTKIYKKG